MDPFDPPQHPPYGIYPMTATMPNTQKTC